MGEGIDPLPNKLGEEMKLRVSTRQLEKAICMVISLGFLMFGVQGNLNAQTKNNNLKPANLFRDKLGLPAKSSQLAPKSVLNGIAVAGERVVAVGVRGHIIYSDDKGKTWTQSSVPVSVDLTAVYFPTPKKGWAVGHDGVVLHSSDGGATWKKQLDGSDICRIMDQYYREHPLFGKHDTESSEKMKADIKGMAGDGPINPILDVWFENESTGFIIGAFNLIMRTDDGGKSWIPWFDRTDNPMGMHLYCIKLIGADVFISGEQGLLMRLDRKAGCFKALKTPYAGTYFGILGNSGLIVAFGMRGNILCSQDGGKSWKQNNFEKKEGILGGALLANGDIALVTQGGNVLIKKNGAEHFTAIKRESGAAVPAHAVVAIDAKTLIIAGWFGIQVQPI